MSVSDLLGLYAELSLGLSGFAGVASAFAGRSRDFRPIERTRVLGVLLNSGGVLAGCLVFLAADASGFEGSIPLRLAAAASLAVTLFVPINVLPPAWRHMGDPDSTTELWVLLVATSGIATNLGLYAATIGFDLGPAFLLTAFTLQMLLGLWMFARLLTREN